MLSSILSLLGLLPKAFDTIDNITNAIANEKIAQINATTAQAQAASEERISALQSARDVLVADAQKSSWDIWMRTIIASGPAFILCKIFFYDETGFGTTTIPTDSPLWTVIMVVLGFYFLHSVLK